VNAAHLDYETLADLAEGILDGPRAASANAHLTGCATCQEREAELTEVSRLLAEVPAPTVPAELVSRIDAALAAAVAETPASGGARRWRRGHVVLAAAAAAAVVVVGGGTAFLQTSGIDRQTAGGSAEGARPPSGVPADKSQQPGASSSGLTLRAGNVTRSGTDYRKSRLAAQVADVRGRALGQRRPGGPGAASESAPGILSTQLAGCVHRIGNGRTPLLIDQASYEGARATIIVFPGRPDTFDVWITGLRCSSGTSDVIHRTEVSRTK
jgi:hypothetical protein